MPNFVHQGFFCQTEDDFDDWCAQIRKVLEPKMASFFRSLRSCLFLWLTGHFCFSLAQVSNCRGLPMFELVDSQPSHLIGADVINLTPGNL